MFKNKNLRRLTPNDIDCMCNGNGISEKFIESWKTLCEEVISHSKDLQKIKINMV